MPEIDPREEGVYCRWEEYPAHSRNFSLVIERVNGDGSVSRLECTRVESRVIAQFLCRPIQ